MQELEIRGLAVVNQQAVAISYKGVSRQELLRFDVLVDSCILIEIKAVERVLPVHKAQLLSYLKLLDLPLGLLVNFNTARVTDGVTRLILPGADQAEYVPALANNFSKFRRFQRRTQRTRIEAGPQMIHSK